PTFDSSFGPATMGPVGPSFSMGMSADDASISAHTSHQMHLDTSAEDLDMLVYSNAVSPTDGMPAASSHAFRPAPSAADQRNGSGDGVGAPKHDLTTVL